MSKGWDMSKEAGDVKFSKDSYCLSSSFQYCLVEVEMGVEQVEELADVVECEICCSMVCIDEITCFDEELVFCESSGAFLKRGMPSSYGCL